MGGEKYIGKWLKGGGRDKSNLHDMASSLIDHIQGQY